MAITFEFYGLTLFVWNRRDPRVLLPNTAGITLPPGTSEHFPLYHDKDNAAIGLATLRGHTVEITGVGGHPQRRTGGDMIEIHGEQPLKQMKLISPREEQDPVLVAGRILLNAGGEVSVKTTGQSNAGERAYRFGTRSSAGFACAVKWVINTRITIKFAPALNGIDEYTVEPSPDRVIQIGNVDGRTVRDLECRRRQCAGDSSNKMLDRDFEILYRLFKNVPTQIILPEADCNKVPRIDRPLGVRDEFVGATTTTCFGGEWCDEPNPNDCP